MIGRLEGCTSGHELIDGDSECPHINTLIVPTPLEHLRRTVIESACDGQHVALAASIEYLPTYTEVNQFYVLLLYIVKDIFRLDVSMADSLRVDVGQCF